MTGLLLVGLVPFIVMGIILGHLVRAEALTVSVGGLVAFFAIFGGAYDTLFSGALLTFVKLLASYWLAQAGKGALLRRDWAAEGWIVVAVWTVVLVPLATLAYRRETGRG